MKLFFFLSLLVEVAYATFDFTFSCIHGNDCRFLFSLQIFWFRPNAKTTERKRWNSLRKFQFAANLLDRFLVNLLPVSLRHRSMLLPLEHNSCVICSRRSHTFVLFTRLNGSACYIFTHHHLHLLSLSFGSTLLQMHSSASRSCHVLSTFRTLSHSCFFLFTLPSSSYIAPFCNALNGSLFALFMGARASASFRSHLQPGQTTNGHVSFDSDDVHLVSLFTPKVSRRAVHQIFAFSTMFHSCSAFHSIS